MINRQRQVVAISRGEINEAFLKNAVARAERA